MNHNQFTLGLDFWSGHHQWRCTDIGTRVIVAIRLDPVETSQQNLTRAEAEKEGWFNGPPYAIREMVFDEDDLQNCSLTQSL